MRQILEALHALSSPQDPRALTDQLRDLVPVANACGLRDAADFLTRMSESKNNGWDAAAHWHRVSVADRGVANHLRALLEEQVGRTDEAVRLCQESVNIAERAADAARKWQAEAQKWQAEAAQRELERYPSSGHQEPEKE